VFDNGSLEIMMNNEEPVAGFQFDISGLNIVGASGGSAEANGFMVSASGSTVIGFSLTGSTIPSANGVLVNVQFDNAGDEFCLSNPILSDSGAGQYDVDLGNCFNGFGCMDMSACNYDPAAQFDDGSCAYENDCLGECGGDAEIDSCGVCDGMDGDIDCFGVCFGDGFTDIAGDCCESSEADACGLCFGPATNPEDCIPLVTVSISDLLDHGDNTFTATRKMQNTVPVAVNVLSPWSNKSDIETVTSGIQSSGFVAGPKQRPHASASELSQQSPAISVKPSPKHTPKQSISPSIPSQTPQLSISASPPHSPKQSFSYAQDPSSN
jgi:hypothetical protein